MAKESTANAEAAPQQHDFSGLSESQEAELPGTPVPDEVKTFVDHAYKFWQQSPKKWRTVTLATEAAAKRAKNLAKEHAKATGRCFRTRKHDDPKTLIYRVTDANKPRNG